MYERILVPLDGSKLAQEILPYVRFLAMYLHARIELLRVIGPLPPELSSSLGDRADLNHIGSSMSKHAQEDLETASAS